MKDTAFGFVREEGFAVSNETTMVKRRKDMLHKAVRGCHQGNGEVDLIAVLVAEDIPGKTLRFVHDDILAPGVSIGIHRHADDEEYYYVVSGNGTMTLDGKRVEVQAGDITGVFPGGSHGLENTSYEDLRILVIGGNRRDVRK